MLAFFLVLLFAAPMYPNEPHGFSQRVQTSQEKTNGSPANVARSARADDPMDVDSEREPEEEEDGEEDDEEEEDDDEEVSDSGGETSDDDEPIDSEELQELKAASKQPLAPGLSQILAQY
eukprot:NODE_82_length_22625_cov_0.476516.p16 type:complete len:120 gc:universal NODE_82_length_22625_cov_0.476516:13631-13990(+)